MEIPSPPDPRSPIHHRAPILCVDRIVDAGTEHSECEYDVREGPHVEDGRMWEVGMVEGLAQCAAVMQAFPGLDATSSEASAEREGVGMLVGIRRFVVLRRPRVGERITWRVDLVKRLGPYLLADGRARCGDEEIARGELKFFWEVGT
jgi:predicted hotdog family 3-hydroxylacyl-ACP dehydratase